MFGHWRVIVDERWPETELGRAMSAAHGEFVRGDLSADGAEYCGDQHD
jgi:hypothetical protein